MNAGRSRYSRVIKDHHNLAFAYISKALRIDKDEAGDKEQAVLWYKEGIAELERGIAVELTGQEDLYELTKTLQDSMICQLTMARDKLSLLEATLASERSNHVLPQPQPVHNWNPAMILFLERRNKYVDRKVAPQTQEAQNWKPAAVKQPPNRELKNLILSQIVDSGVSVSFEDIAGQKLAKEELNINVIYPALTPEILEVIDPPRGLLLFGPPGNGKTMLAKAAAAESNVTFFNITPDNLPWQGEGESEKFVQELFAVARELKPSVIFVDNVDCLLYKRWEGEDDVSQTLRAHFLFEFERVRRDDRVVVIGATDRPQDLSAPLLTLFDIKVYVGLPDAEARFTLLKKQGNPLSETELSSLVELTEGYSGDDLTLLAQHAEVSLNRDLGDEQLPSTAASEMRKVNMKDFEESMKHIKPLVDPATLNKYIKWNEQYGNTRTVSRNARKKPSRLHKSW